MTIRTAGQRASAIEAGQRLGLILEQVSNAVIPGITTAELDALAERLIRAGGDEPSFKGYTPEGAARPYPAALCVSVNDEVVHGIPAQRALKEGDIVSLDLGLTHDGIIMDSALTVPVGTVSQRDTDLMRATQNALEAAILAARAGARIGDIEAATGEAFESTPFKVVRELGGHGVGDRVHEAPFIANAGHAGTGEEITEGMVLALEPIANDGKAAVQLAPDGFTYRTKDGSRSAHFEHTILIEKGGPLVLTRRPSEG